MTTGTAFGPQGAGAATSPGTFPNRYGSSVHTWVQNADCPTSKGGTKLDAAFFNMILGNLRHLVQTAKIPLDDGDMTLVYRAIVAIASGAAIAAPVLSFDSNTGILTMTDSTGAKVQANLSSLQSGSTGVTYSQGTI